MRIFKVSDEVYVTRTLTEEPILSKRYLLSALARAGGGIVIDKFTIGRIRGGQIRDLPVPEKLRSTMEWLAEQSTEFGARLTVDASRDYPVAWCRSAQEFSRLIETLATESPYLLSRDTTGLWIRAEGWSWLRGQPKKDRTIGFIAMWFDPSMKEVRGAIEDGITRAGYTPIVVDKDEFVGGVMDQIIARIRSARFVVADFCGNRGGVYYEAGFAVGIGTDVFCLCEQKQLGKDSGTDRIHFDVAHLRMIPWERSRLDLLSERLTASIEAVVGNGPGVPET